MLLNEIGFRYVINENIAFGKRQFQSAGGRCTDRIGGGAAVDEIETSRFQDGENLINRVVHGCQFRAHMVVHTRNVRDGGQIFIQSAVEFIGRQGCKKGSGAGLDVGIFIGLHGEMEHHLQSLSMGRDSDFFLKGAVWKHRKSERCFKRDKMPGEAQIVTQVINNERNPGPAFSTEKRDLFRFSPRSVIPWIDFTGGSVRL